MKKAEPIADQIDRFKETARALGCDEDKVKFEAQLGKIVTHKPDKPAPTTKKPNKQKPAG